MEVGLPVAPRDAPRCDLWGHGVFKGAWWRMEWLRGGRKEREGRRVCSKLRTDGRDCPSVLVLEEVGGLWDSGSLA